MEQGAIPRAAQLLEQAARSARSAEERRQVAYERERVAARSGRAGDLDALYARWARSDDGCLRAAARQRLNRVGAPAALVGMPQP